MKIRIITYHSVINRGALLQALGLQINFKSLFPHADVKVVDSLPHRLTLYEFLRAIPKKGSGFDKWHRFILIKNDVKNIFDLEKISPRKLADSLKQDDMLVIGSDCIWRIDNKIHLPVFPNQYWLPYKTAAKKISFSTSAVGSNLELVNIKKDKIKTLINDFDLVSVRDNFTKEIIGREDALITPDPSFFVPLRNNLSYPELVQTFINENKKLYGLQIYNNHYPEHIKAYIKFNSNNKVIGLTNNFVTDLNIDHLINTLQWAQIYRELCFHVTDSFHGTIFSIRNKIPFLSLETGNIPPEHSKKYSLLSFMGLEDLYVNLNEYKSDVKILSKRQEDIISRWNSDYLPIVNDGLHKATKELDTYNKKILELCNKE